MPKDLCVVVATRMRLVGLPVVAHIRVATNDRARRMPDKKIALVKVRVSPAQKAAWESQARDRDESVSELIRKTMSRTAPRSKPQEPACHRSVSDSD